MANVVLAIKLLIVYLLPFYLIQLYLKYAYGVGAGTKTNLWAKTIKLVAESGRGGGELNTGGV